MKRWVKAAIGLLVVSAVVGGVAKGYYFEAIDVDTPKIDVKTLSKTGLTHAHLDQVLSTFVDERGRVDYGALRKNRGSLDAYVGLIGQVGPTTTPALFQTKAEKLAYYLNAYNAFVLLGVVVRPDIANVHDDKFRFFYGATFALDGRRTNLYDLENTTIRQGFNEPRIHFALNCASLGCPRLPQQAFAPSTLEATLAALTAEFLAEKRNLAVDPKSGTVTVSKIFDWYNVDFAPTPLAWIAATAPSAGVDKKATLTFQPWDWSLNAQ